MATTHTNIDPVPVASLPHGPSKERTITIISHSSLFYWWPVWFVGFLMAAATYVENNRMAVVPAGTEAIQGAVVEGIDGSRDVLVLPAEKFLYKDKETGQPVQPHIRVSADSNPGGFFVLTFLLVLLITNVPLRGVWSWAAILFILATAFFLAWMRWWDDILRLFGLVDIHINASGYMILSVCVFVMWFLITFVFDRLIYIIFTPGQFRIHQQVGEGETAYDTFGISVHKRRNDFFRHWILGFGSGDLVVTTGGANPQIYEFPNVLFLGRKVEVIEQMLQEREVIAGQMKG